MDFPDPGTVSVYASGGVWASVAGKDSGTVSVLDTSFSTQLPVGEVSSLVPSPGNGDSVGPHPSDTSFGRLSYSSPRDFRWRTRTPCVGWTSLRPPPREEERGPLEDDPEGLQVLVGLPPVSSGTTWVT